MAVRMFCSHAMRNVILVPNVKQHSHPFHNELRINNHSFTIGWESGRVICLSYWKIVSFSCITIFRFVLRLRSEIWYCISNKFVNLEEIWSVKKFIGSLIELDGCWQYDVNLESRYFAVWIMQYTNDMFWYGRSVLNLNQVDLIMQFRKIQLRVREQMRYRSLNLYYHLCDIFPK